LQCLTHANCLSEQPDGTQRSSSSCTAYDCQPSHAHPQDPTVSDRSGHDSWPVRGRKIYRLGLRPWTTRDPSCWPQWLLLLLLRLLRRRLRCGGVEPALRAHSVVINKIAQHQDASAVRRSKLYLCRMNAISGIGKA
jgi:hypothetical protein